MLALGGVKIYELVWLYRKNSNDLRGSPLLVTPQEDKPLPGGTGNPNQSQEAHGCVSPAQEDLGSENPAQETRGRQSPALEAANSHKSAESNP